MIRTRNRPISSALGALTLTFIAVCPCLGQADRLPEQVERALRSNEAAASHLTVGWAEHFSTTLPIKAVLQRAGVWPDFKAFLEKRIYRYIRQDAMFYHYRDEILQVPPEAPYRERHEWSYDGSFVYEQRRAANIGAPDSSAMPLITIQTPKLIKEKRTQAPIFRALFLTAAGFYVPWEILSFDQPLRSLVLHLLESPGSRLQVKEEKEALHVTISLKADVHEFWLSPRLGYAVERYVHSVGAGHPFMDAKNSDFQRVGETNLWIPRRSEVTYYGWNNLNNWTPPPPENISREPLLRVGLEATEIGGATHPIEQFRIEPRDSQPGSVIADGRLPGAENSKYGWVSYVVPADKRDLDQAIARAGQSRRGEGPTSGSRAWLFVGANILLGALIISVVLWRRARADRPKRSTA
jgi:hypothetical protein